MSIVPPTGVLRKLYNDAQRQNIEFKSSAFRQVYLQRAFFEDEYIVVCEFPPDSSKRRVDIVVRCYDHSQDTLVSFLFHECKAPHGNVREAEKQALSAGLLAMRGDRVSSVYVVTTIGTRFRAYDEAADRSSYVDADSPDAEELTRAVALAKRDPPLLKAPMVPSQPLTLLDNLGSNEEYDQGADHSGDYASDHLGDYEEYGQGWSGAGGAGSSMEGVVYHSSEFFDHSEEEETRSPSGTGKETRKVMHVRVERIGHMTRPSEYVFKKRDGKRVSTRKKDWAKRQAAGGQTVWEYKGRSTTYVTDRID